MLMDKTAADRLNRLHQGGKVRIGMNMTSVSETLS